MAVSGISLVSVGLREARLSMQQSIYRLSTGLRINSSKDDPGRVGLLSRLNTTVRSATEAARNITEAEGYVTASQTALTEMMSIVQQIRDAASIAAQGSTTSDEREALQAEVNALLDLYNDLSENSKFNSRPLLDGSFSSRAFQIGPDPAQSITFSIGDARSFRLGTLATKSGAQAGITTAISAGVNEVVINGIRIGDSASDGVSVSLATASARAVSEAINLKTDQTGVTAEVVPTTVELNDLDFAALGAAGLINGAFQINSVSIVGAPASASAFVDLINNSTSQTGVVATIGSGGDDVVLQAYDGRNILLSLGNAATYSNAWDVFDASSSGNSAVLGAAVTAFSQGATKTNQGAILLRSSEEIVIANGSAGSASASLGFSGSSVKVDLTSSLANVSVLTQDTATEAIRRLDAAIADITDLSSSIGAVHNRLTTSSSVLEGVIADTGLSIEKITTVDYALELTNLVSNQIQSQAALAALAQANVNESAVLSLLGALG